MALILRVQFAAAHELVAIHLPLALFFLTLNLRFRLFRFFLLSIGTTFGYLFVGNFLFANSTCALNLSDIPPRYACALLATLPRTIMLLYGFAWINSGDAQTFTQTFTRLAIPLGRAAGPTRYIAGASQYFCQLASEYETLEYALKFHLTVRERRLGLASRIQITWLKLGAVIFKMFYAIPDFAYALESRYARAQPITHPATTVKVELVQFRAKRRTPAINLAPPLQQRAQNYIDLDELPDYAAIAVFDVLSGIVPHLRGSVSGTVAIGDDENFLSWPQDRKFSYARYVCGTSSSRQLLGPTVQFEMEASATSRPRIDQALKYWGLSGDCRKRVQELSGGERVRLALASAMASDSKVILLDDVEGQLDRSGRLLLHEWIDAEQSEGGRLFVGRRTRRAEMMQRTAKPAAHTLSIDCTSNQRPIVAVEHLRLVRAGHTLLNNWSHSFYRGTITVLTGPNGVGKTSLGLVIGGAINPASGRILRSVPVGMSFQNPLEQVFRFTAENELAVRSSLACFSLLERLSYVHDSLNVMRLPGEAEIVDLGAAPLRTLSVYAMLFKSGFLILDEPSNNLTTAELGVLMNIVDDLRNRGIALLIITHDPAVWDADATLQLGIS